MTIDILKVATYVSIYETEYSKRPIRSGFCKGGISIALT